MSEEKLPSRFAVYLRDFRRLPVLQTRLVSVLESLPEEVQQDFLLDDRFRISVDNYERGKGSTVLMAAPGAYAEKSRSVILRPLLNDCEEAFALYVIAHEFAHAFLRNGPWGEIKDVEQAADALASHWGYDRPAITPWTRRR